MKKITKAVIPIAGLGTQMLPATKAIPKEMLPIVDKALIGDAPFAVVLPDVILDEYTADQRTENLAAMLSRFEVTKASQIMVEPVPMTDVSKYGVVDYKGTELAAGESCSMTRMVEKPVMERLLRI